MLELKPTSALSWTFTISQDGAPVGRLELTRIRGNGTFDVDGQPFEINRPGWFGPYVLSADGREVATARRSQLLPARFTITAPDRELQVASAGFLPKHARIIHGDVVMGSVRRQSIFRREVTVDVNEPTPTPLIIFLATVIILYWRQQSRSS